MAALQRMGKADPLLRHDLSPPHPLPRFYPAKSGLLFAAACRCRATGDDACNVNEHRTHARGLADLLLADALIDDGILLQQDGSLLAGWSYRGPDMMSASPAGDGRAQRAA